MSLTNGSGCGAIPNVQRYGTEDRIPTIPNSHGSRTLIPSKIRKRTKIIRNIFLTNSSCSGIGEPPLSLCAAVVGAIR